MMDLHFTFVFLSINDVFGGEFENDLVGFIGNFSSEGNVGEFSEVSVNIGLVSVKFNISRGRRVSKFDVFFLHGNSFS